MTFDTFEGFAEIAAVCRAVCSVDSNIIAGEVNTV